MSLFEVNEAAEVIKQAVDPDANIIFGVASDNNMGNDVRITLIATGFVAGSVSDAEEEDEITQVVRNIKSEEELDLPSFLRLRRPNFSRQALPQSQTCRPQQRNFIR